MKKTFQELFEDKFWNHSIYPEKSERLRTIKCIRYRYLIRKFVECVKKLASSDFSAAIIAELVGSVQIATTKLVSQKLIAGLVSLVY